MAYKIKSEKLKEEKEKEGYEIYVPDNYGKERKLDVLFETRQEAEDFIEDIGEEGEDFRIYKK